MSLFLLVAYSWETQSRGVGRWNLGLRAGIWDWICEKLKRCEGVEGMGFVDLWLLIIG